MLERSQSWQDNIVIESDTLRAAASAMDKASHKIALVVSSDQKLIGTLTDGDLRRGLLAGANLEDEVKQWMNRELISATDSASDSELTFSSISSSLS